MLPTIDRLLAKVTEDANGCWIFTGSIARTGYGQVRTNNRNASTHRVTYEYFRDDIPPGLVIDHLCRVRACCNPWHLEPVTQRINILRGNGPLTAGSQLAARERAKTHCPANHEYTEANTQVTWRGHRKCRTCKRLWMAAFRKRAA
jgi:hypothetical protein